MVDSGKKCGKSRIVCRTSKPNQTTVTDLAVQGALSSVVYGASEITQQALSLGASLTGLWLRRGSDDKR